MELLPLFLILFFLFIFTIFVFFENFVLNIFENIAHVGFLEKAMKTCFVANEKFAYYTMIVVNPRNHGVKSAIFRMPFGIFPTLVSVTFFWYCLVGPIVGI